MTEKQEFIYIYPSIYIYITHIHICTYMYTHVHICIHTYTHTQVEMPKLLGQMAEEGIKSLRRTNVLDVHRHRIPGKIASD